MSTLSHSDGTPVSEHLRRLLADVAAHPDTSAREIAQRVGGSDRDVFRTLNNAAYSGLCQCSRASNGPWLWEIPQAVGRALAPTCPDDGTCHHSCPSAAACFRVACCGPLSGVFPGNRWPEAMPAAARKAREGHLTVEDVIVGAAVIRAEPEEA